MLWMFFLFVLIIFFVRKWKMKRFVQLSNKIKCGIKSYPLIGHAYLFAGSGINRMEAFKKFGQEAIKNGGITSLWLGGRYYVVSADAADLEIILKKALDKDDITRFAKELVGNGLIFSPVSMWRHRRKVLVKTFNPKNLNNFMEVFTRQGDIMLNQMRTVVGKGAISVWNYFNTLTLDTICENTLNIQLNLQHQPEQPFLKSFEICSKLVATRMVQPWLHFDPIYKLLPYYHEFSQHKRIVLGFIAEAINSKRQTMKDDKNSNQGQKSLLEFIMESREYSDLALHEDTLVIVIAGTDTSSVAMSFTISMMAKYPHVQDKVAQELQEVFGDSGRKVTSEDLPRLKYLEAVIKETLRLYPPAPMIARKIVTDLQLPSGVTLINGCGVFVNIWAVHRNPLYWGEDAEQFRPERFIEAPLRHPAAFIAFSHGPRNCIGYNYAMMSMKTALATILRSYRVLHVNDEEDNDNNINDKPTILSFDVMMKDVDGFKVKLEKRTYHK